MPSLYKRSLIKIGNGSLVVVIPKSWATYHKLKAGDKVQVKANRNLTVYPKVIQK